MNEFSFDQKKIFIAHRIISTKWNIHILFILSHGPSKFSEILHIIPSISDTSLSRCLKGLQTDGIVKKTVSMDRPLQIVYELTPKGLSLAEIIPYLVIWTGIVDPYKKVNAQYPNCKIINRQ